MDYYIKKKETKKNISELLKNLGINDTTYRREIYPLQNSVTSLTSKKSVSFSVRNKTSLDKDRTFNFNKDIKHYCYVADGNDLACDLKILYTFFHIHT